MFYPLSGSDEFETGVTGPYGLCRYEPGALCRSDIHSWDVVLGDVTLFMHDIPDSRITSVAKLKLNGVLTYPHHKLLMLHDSSCGEPK